MTTSSTINSAGLVFDNSYARELTGLYAPWQAAQVPQASMTKLNLALAAELGLDAAALGTELGVAIFSGNQVPAGATPLAQAYSGHQFGRFSPQLGDGRALLLGEVIDTLGQRRDIAFKGSGRTPFSRGGDGKATLGPMLREYLISEAMHALGIPTTRALAVVSTGEAILREGVLPGAVLTRVASSHIRVGTFQYVSAQDKDELIRQLADYVIARHDPALSSAENPYLSFLQAVSERQAALIAQWMLVGFIHGVMNTDNMTISGETIDYGPCAFMDSYDSDTVFSSIDRQGRYAYSNQPQIAQWNLARLAETLLTLIDPDPERAVLLATAVLDSFPQRYQAHWLAGMRNKLGWTGEQPADMELARDFLASMEGQGVDFTMAFRRLADLVENGDANGLRDLYDDASQLDTWLPRWRARLAVDALDAPQRAAGMRAVNPLYIPRNHLVEQALNSALQGNMLPFEKLLEVLQNPYQEQAELALYTEPASAAAAVGYRTFCGT
ncbi:protein adenylyltransferase SelO [Undibacterium sp. Ren11W]|uniref:protein adenylyltransferase SelO n=1 Tax=Undibacterium sp. Ren11W TaxID=3413045 RepID=UPI003BF41195